MKYSVAMTSGTTQIFLETEGLRERFDAVERIECVFEEQGSHEFSLPSAKKGEFGDTRRRCRIELFMGKRTGSRGNRLGRDRRLT